MTEEVQLLLKKSDHALEVSEKLLKSGYFSDAAGKAYYAMFYAAQAVLKSHNINVIKHSAVESSFGYSFVKTGKISPKYHRMLIEARKIREIADYALDEKILKSVASKELKEGKEFVKQSKEYLRNN